jgi:hypothetical protein
MEGKGSDGREGFGWKGRVRMEGKGSDGREGFGWKGKVRKTVGILIGKGSENRRFSDRERFGKP